MAIFTAIGAAVAGAIGFAAGTLAFTVVSTIVATGAAMLVSRVLNPTPKGGAGGAAASEGTRIQLPPGTQNKLPVLYGRAFANGIIVDAYLSSNNQEMTYVMALTETTNINGQAYTVNDVYWNDLRLEFDGDSAVRGKKRVNAAYNEPEDFTNNDFSGHVWLKMWAWNNVAQQTQQIFGGTGQHPSEYIGNGWDVTYNMQGMVFAVLKIKYNPEKQFTGLPNLTFDISSNITNPAQALLDYMTSSRYGAGISPNDLDIASFFDWATYCDQTAPWTPIDGGATQYSKRYEINGIVSTQNDAKQNIDSLLLSSAAWLSYDTHSGKWRIIPKRAVTQPNMTFGDSVITTGVNLSSTRIEDLYNVVEVSYYDRENRDAQAFKSISLFEENPALLNYNERENIFGLNLEFCNNNIQAERIANMELEQTRDDLVVTFGTGHYGLQCQAGDVIGVFNSVYGWQGQEFPQGKLFRVMRVKEYEGDEGTLGAEITALEYNAQVYDDKTIAEFYPTANIGIPITGSDTSLPAPAVEIIAVNPGASIPNFKIRVTTPGAATANITGIELWYAEGDDWAGLGSDVIISGAFSDDQLVVSSITGSQIYSIAQDGVGSAIVHPRFNIGTRVLNYGHVDATLQGVGRLGAYTLDTVQTASAGEVFTNARALILKARYRASITDTTMTVTEIIDGTIVPQCLITDSETGLLPGTIVLGQLTGATGGVGTYQISKSQTIPETEIFQRYPYPQQNDYQLLTTIKHFDEPLFTTSETRDVAISSLPENGINKRYFLRARVFQDGELGTYYGPFSDLGAIDLENETISWVPDPSAATKQLLDIKENILKLDMGKLVIPNNGLWFWRTMTQIDFSTVTLPSPYQLDLGAIYPLVPSVDVDGTENTVSAEVLLEEFLWQGDEYNEYVPPVGPTEPTEPTEPEEPSVVYLDTLTAGVGTTTFRADENNINTWYTFQNASFATLYPGDEVYIRYTYSNPTGYSSIGTAAIEGYIRGSIYAREGLVTATQFTRPQEFERYNDATNSWERLTANEIPIQMTQAPSGTVGDFLVSFGPDTSVGFLKIRYNPITWTSSKNYIGIYFRVMSPDGSQLHASGSVAQPLWFQS